MSPASELRADFAIHDLLLFPLQQGEEALTLLSNQQHLLRRFGQLDLLTLHPGAPLDVGLRGEADRFYFALDGRVELQLEDRREHSPTRGAALALTLDAAEPHGLLLPFGVACTLLAIASARLLLLSTHSETHPGDQPA
ncbi:MAG: hypothetical protein KIS85_08275 [Anaerolineales bacterium]|nr:hypothetical protein [Anaerolineales bacterium]